MFKIENVGFLFKEEKLGLDVDCIEIDETHMATGENQEARY